MHINHSMAAERELVRRIGRELTDMCMNMTAAYPLPLPVTGQPMYSVEGIIMPRMAGGTFTNLADVVAADDSAQEVYFSWNSASTSTHTMDTWNSSAANSVPVYPGTAASAVPGGSVPTSATSGALGQRDAASGDLYLFESSAGSTNPQMVGLWILYDRIFNAALSVTSTSSQAVTGVPTRYATTEAKGNIMFVSTRTAYTTAAAHTWTVGYTDQDGNTGATTGAISGYASSSVVGRIDTVSTTGQWWLPFAAGDTGARAVTSVQLSASQTGGAADIVIARPLAMLPISTYSADNQWNSISNGFNLVKVKPGAALSHVFYSVGLSNVVVTGSHTFIEG